MKNLLVVSVSLPLLVACASQNQKYRIDVGPFFAKASGRVALQNSAGTLAGQYENNIGRDMSLDDTEPSPYIRLQMDKDRHRVRLHGFGVDTDGSDVLVSDFGNLVAGSQVTTSLEFFTIAANYGYQLLRGDNYRFAIGGQAGFYALDVAARSTIGREQVETDVLVPMPFFEGELLLGTLTVGANAALMSADLGDANGRYLDLEGYARWSAAKDFDFFAGYRYMVLDAFGRASSRDFDADVDVEGFFVGAGVRF